MLLTRLRPAFDEAARAHADVVKLDPEQLERMVQQAADRADGLQWRRALAAVATEELGVGLGEALSHPAVVRAQEIAGAPAYEDSLAELGVAPAPATRPSRVAQPPPAARSSPVAPPAPAAPASPAPAARRSPAARPARAARSAPAGEKAPRGGSAPAGRSARPAERAPAAERAPMTEPAPAATEAPAAKPSSEEAPTGTIRPLRLTAIHLGGVASLAHGERDVELSFSESGLDILRAGEDLLGRLPWQRIRALELPPTRARRLRRRQPGAHIVIRTADGAASFEIPAVSPEQLREQLVPLVERHGVGSD